MGGVVEQAKTGSVDAQLACYGHEDGYKPQQQSQDQEPVPGMSHVDRDFALAEHL
jgi:hypothetical protein